LLWHSSEVGIGLSVCPVHGPWIYPGGCGVPEALWIGLDMDLTPHGWIMDGSQVGRCNGSLAFGLNPAKQVTVNIVYVSGNIFMIQLIHGSPLDRPWMDNSWISVHDPGGQILDHGPIPNPGTLCLL
jgi:hypothetical protein